jgi:hypothetical protein
MDIYNIDIFNGIFWLDIVMAVLMQT